MCHQQDQAAKVLLFVQDFDTLDRILWIQISETLSLFTYLPRNIFWRFLFLTTGLVPKERKKLFKSIGFFKVKASKRSKSFNP